jgi:hypothetical protein
MQGTLRKMRTSLDENHLVHYRLPVGDQEIKLNPLIGENLTLTHTGSIFCYNCGKKTKKSYSQGHCYVCMTKLASCDMCIMKPETCHFALGTCREPQWGEQNCFIPHYVYLSNTSSVKVGITRHTQLPTRWIDQGATQGLPIFKVSSRLVSGLVEVALSKLISDKTHWQAMLKGNAIDLDLTEKAEELLPQISSALQTISDNHGEQAIERLNESVRAINYPISEFPEKIKSHNFDKGPIVSGKLLGIKGQYLIFDSGVINVRKFGSYEVSILGT